MEVSYIFALTALAICLWAFWPDLQDLWARICARADNNALDIELGRKFNAWAEKPKDEE